VERAKILGLAATQIGVVEGSELAIKAGVWEGKWPLVELHDLWWNAIARAMAL